MLTYESTPLQFLPHSSFEAAGIEVNVKREDLNHSLVSGNKWWKLRDNLKVATTSRLPILTFGGAYSNHIFATAAAAHELGLKSVGVIRGERIEPLNETLRFAEAKGMHLHFVSRKMYMEKTEGAFIMQLKKQFGDFYLIPEGGTNKLAIEACDDFARTHLSSLEFDQIFLPVGTGGTIAGIINGLKGKSTITGISVLRNGAFLISDVKMLLRNNGFNDYGNWEILTSYDHGGYAKATDELKRFIVEMYQRYSLPLDFVYTGKLLWAVIEEAKKGNLRRGSKIVVLHTGGLQNSQSFTTTASNTPQ